MIEQGLYFGLGFALAGLFALGFVPVLWSRALRLTRQRLEARIPISMREILADRDHLRAEFAVERCKLEQAMERVRAEKAGDMAELGRRALRIDALDAQRATAQASADDLSRALAEMGAQAGALTVALHDTHVYFEKRLGDVEALRRAHDALEAGAEARRATIAGLNTRVMGLEMTIEDATRARANLERQLGAMKQALTLVSEERDELFTKGVDLEKSLAEKCLALAPALAEESADVESARIEPDAARADTRILELEAALARAEREGRDREKGLHLKQSLKAGKARGGVREATDKIEATLAENAALRVALEAARRGAVPPLDESGQTPRHDGPPDDTTPRDGDAVLRGAIHELGLVVAAMTRAAREAQVADATPINPKPVDTAPIDQTKPGKSVSGVIAAG